MDISRRGLLSAFAGAAVGCAPVYANAAGFLRGAGDIRRYRATNQRTAEAIDIIYWVEGEYISDALDEINYFMRDWRRNEVKKIDTRTIDVKAAVTQMLDTDAPLLLLSGYRSPATNNALRNRSRGVAKKSLHMVGKAADIRVPGRSVSQIARAAAACKAGGVGRYSGSNFVHVDCGVVRTWGR